MMYSPKTGKMIPKSAGCACPESPTKQINSTSAQSEPSTSGTVRDRRGFRPLSILTNFSLYPFDRDVLHAMDLVEKDTNEFNQGTQSARESTYVDGWSKPSSCDLHALQTLPFSNESEISLRQFLVTTAPPKDHEAAIKKRFSDLLLLPAPPPMQHPAWQKSPFDYTSTSPCLFTTCSAEKIQKVAKQRTSHLSTSTGSETQRTSSSNDSYGNVDKGKFGLPDSFKTPDSLHKRASGMVDHTSPLSPRRPAPRYQSIEIFPSPSPFCAKGEHDSRPGSSASLRKLSGLFKPRSSTDRSSPPSKGLETMPALSSRDDLETHLRRSTYSPSFNYHPNSWYPRHPKTSKQWKSRNLKCTTCVEICCACCGRACCAYKAAVMALDNHKAETKCYKNALEVVQQITALFPYGKEVPTFLMCTSGNNHRTGCGKLVCPDCCGLCPDEACNDIQCRRCKKNPWAECDWHVGLLMAMGTEVK